MTAGANPAAAWVNLFSAQAPAEYRDFANCRCTCGARERLNPHDGRIAQLNDVKARYEASVIDANGELMEHLALAGMWFQIDVEAVAKFCICPDAVRIRTGS